VHRTILSGLGEKLSDGRTSHRVNGLIVQPDFQTAILPAKKVTEIA
jgi:hypothetical protein